MAQIIDMPKLSDTMTVGTLVRWLKKEGDRVSAGEMLAEVETDKATMELECFFDGTLLRIFVPAGSQVEIGVALCAVGKPGEKVGVPEGKAAGAAPSAPPPPAPPAPKAPAQPRPAAPAGKAVAVAPKPAPPPPPVQAPAGRIRISPLARKLAAEKGMDPSRVAGSGPGGRIVRADILAAENAGVAQFAASCLTPQEGAPVAAGPSVQEERLVPVSNMRATVARRLLESKTQIPHFYLETEIDAEPLLTLRSQINASFEQEGIKLSVNDFILKGAAEALRNVPAVNCSWEAPAGPSGTAAIRFHSSANVAFAVAMEDGLITPVIRDAQAKSLLAISTEAKGLAKRAKEKKLAPAEYTGGTFCVSNLGMMGVERFSAIINPPNSAILAVGATVRKPVVRDDKIVIGQRMSLTLSCDHRVVDGALGATFLASLKEILEKPTLLLL
jgi:pyruvate dehydrogenase E2 component (dihydrolipoamide acetyltransferase)